ncbi:Wadjet anti-phage system protein JetA family protein [Desulfitobacterium hafniense]|uniref:Uncharacterized protein n=4 Tax=root TaxID=1 RepID=Q24ZP5_DESHY|nr:Wadjet anti-phage system protein JetA family protein [Desulfitobacterium hafniense]ACL18733.1 conserved hypothetical protein [Desulfitobacterium hafniense DCB-2]KTE89101.1 hypothetical protein AT727_13830 [Desulfitobacterium hafniense]MEA5024278.1 DUF5716 family protein [Desulfitobacterium hafniense]CDX00703.1 Hypothetical protein DPCES_0816 [Desulfitobacterium hafniense]BAE82497.1 hypothetical protein DSY0708 [Desulfitobacterium hafniense Y51]
MKLFEILPESFFQLFTGKNRQVYAEALLLLYEQYQVNRFGVDYEVMRDLLQELIETQESLGYSFEVEEGEEAPEADLFRTQVNSILRRLKVLGWLDVETRDNFKQYILLPHYSSRILQVFKELCEERTVEFQRFAFVTYQLLTSEEAKRRPAFAMIEAEKTTEQFTGELTLLANNMKFHAEQVAAKTSIQEVLDHHFDEYKTKIVDKSYHRLKTSDHVSRYRHQILERVRTLLIDQEIFQEAVEDGIRSEFFATREEAEHKLRQALLSVEEVYRELDEVFNRIDLRHNQYLRASFDRARYLSQHSQGVDQRLAEILDWLSERRSSSKDIGAKILGPEGLRFLTLSQLSEPSVFTPRKKRLPHQAEDIEVIQLSPELKAQLREESLSKMRRNITREKVRDYVLAHLGQRETMGIAELAPQNLEEFLYLTYVYLYGYDGGAGYTLEREYNRVLEIGGYRFHDRQIRRLTAKKEGSHRVRATQ